MRYVIVIMASTFYVLWQSLYDDWGMTRAISSEVMRLWHMMF